MRSSLRRKTLEPLAAVAIAFCFLGPTVAGAASSTTRLLVKFKPAASAEAQASVLSSVHAKQIGVLHDLGIKIVTVPTAGAQATANAMRGNPLVSFAEPDSILKPQDNLPSDPSFPSNFALAGGAWGWPATHTTQAWDITQGDPNVVIAILDTGIKTTGLSDFNGQISSTYNAMTGTDDVTTNAGNHGTYVAGIAGLAADNATGSAGFCPGCRLMIVQVGTDSGAYLSDIASGLTYAADHGARVANMSWAGTSDSSTLQTATTYAHQHGVVMTAAAGNSNCNCATYPAADPYVLGVAGVDNSGNKAGDSNYGSWVQLAAPEGNMTAWPSINGAPGYAPVGGTSSAAPVVAGIAGLLLSADPALTTTQVVQALEKSAAPVGFSVAYGRADALAALQSLGIDDPQPASLPANSVAPQLLVETNASSGYQPLTAAPQVGQVLLRGQGSWTGSAPLSISAVRWQRCTSDGSSCSTLANAPTYTVQSADTGYALRFVVTVKNGLGSTAVASGLSAPVGGTTPPTTTATTTTATTTISPSPPSNSTPPSISGTPQVGETLSASTGSWTGGPTSYGYQWQDCDTSGANCSAIAGATRSNYTAQSADVGYTLRVAVTASNSGGASTASATATSVVTTAPNLSTTQTFSGSLNAKSPSRSFGVTVGSGVASARLSFSKCSALSLALSNGASAAGPSVVSLNATLAPGAYTYTVSGGRCSFTLTVTSASP
jgi:subtilisin family serine protease